MPEELTCFACEQDPVQQCPRCGRPYCEEHGEEVCDACLEPVSGLPSFTLYRGSLLALLIGTALAVWLILQPPGESTDAALGPVVVTPTQPAAAEATATPDTDETPAGDETPGAEGTEAPSGTPAGEGTTTYTVQSGDTLFAICTQLSSLEPQECIDTVLEINGISAPENIAVGQELTVPQ